MIIAINTSFIKKDKSDVDDDFIYEVFSRIIQAQPQHTFIIIVEKDTAYFPFADNVVNAVIGLQARHPAQWLIWYNIKMNRIIKKYKPDIFISYGIGCIKAKVPQYIIIPDLNYKYYPETFKKSELFFYKKYVEKSWKKAALILTVSEFCKADIAKYYKIKESNIQVVYRGINSIFDNETWTNNEETKTKYADGNEYFLYTGEIGLQKNLMNLLKAFSAFKKRQKSNMQLIIAGKPDFKFEKIIESLRLFKFKDEVKIITDISYKEIQKIIIAAYAFVYPSGYEAFPTEIIQAMKSKVAVITSSASAMPETCMDAVLYAQPENFKEMAIQMMQLFKNENIKNIIVEKGREQAEKFSWNVTSDLVWKGIKDILKCNFLINKNALLPANPQ